MKSDKLLFALSGVESVRAKYAVLLDQCVRCRKWRWGNDLACLDFEDEKKRCGVKSKAKYSVMSL